MTANELLQKFMLSLCVWREARGESDLGKQLVAQVIVNRALDSKKRWPQTITGVITQPKQFSSFNPDDPNVTEYPKENGDIAWIRSCWAAERVLSSSGTPLTPANHYHTKDVNPTWADPAKLVMKEGAHLFYQL